jgi:hypothetical protein
MLLRQVAALWRNLFQIVCSEDGRNAPFSATKEGQVIMSRRAIFSLTAAVIIGIGCVATISTDAFAYRGGRAGVGRVGVHHGGAYRAGVYRGAAVRRGVAVGVGAAAVGAGAYGAYGAQRCGYAPYGPCY